MVEEIPVGKRHSGEKSVGKLPAEKKTFTKNSKIKILDQKALSLSQIRSITIELLLLTKKKQIFSNNIIILFLQKIVVFSLIALNSVFSSKSAKTFTDH